MTFTKSKSIKALGPKMATKIITEYHIFANVAIMLCQLDTMLNEVFVTKLISNCMVLYVCNLPATFHIRFNVNIIPIIKVTC